MDKKERQLINYYYEKFTTKNFDEKDFYSFLMLIKEHAKDNQIMTNLIDFIVYREKCTGYAKTYLDECKEIIHNLGKTKVRRKIEPIFSFKEIRSGFNALCQQLGYEKLPIETLNDFMLCIISLLQNVKIVSGSLHKEIGYLSFAASSKEFILMGNLLVKNQGKTMPITFPVLAVQNRYEKITPQDEKDTPYLFDNEIMEVINLNKQLAITFPNMATD